jgi:hypothetical protein
LLSFLRDDVVLMTSVAETPGSVVRVTGSAANLFAALTAATQNTVDVAQYVRSALSSSCSFLSRCCLCAPPMAASALRAAVAVAPCAHPSHSSISFGRLAGPFVFKAGFPALSVSQNAADGSLRIAQHRFIAGEWSLLL